MAESIPVPKNFQYLKAGQIRELESEAASLRKAIEAPNPHGADKGDMGKRLRRIDQMLSNQSPPDLGPAERDAYAKRARELEEQFTQGMPSAEEMRKNPPGAVDKNLAWHRKNARAVAEWKNIQRVLHKGDDSPNYANIERFRPHSTVHDLPMEGAQITGKTFVGTNPSPEYKAGWDRTFGDGESPDADAIAKRLDELEAHIAALKAEPEPKAASPKSSGQKVAMPCGAMKDPRGRKGHIRFCKKCQEIEPPSEPTSPAA